MLLSCLLRLTPTKNGFVESRVAVTDPERFQVELQFSPGAAYDPFGLAPSQPHVFQIKPRFPLFQGAAFHLTSVLAELYQRNYFVPAEAPAFLGHDGETLPSCPVLFWIDALARDQSCAAQPDGHRSDGAAVACCDTG